MATGMPTKRQYYAHLTKDNIIDLIQKLSFLRFPKSNKSEIPRKFDTIGNYNPRFDFQDQNLRMTNQSEFGTKNIDILITFIKLLFGFSGTHLDKSNSRSRLDK